MANSSVRLLTLGVRLFQVREKQIVTIHKILPNTEDKPRWMTQETAMDLMLTC